MSICNRIADARYIIVYQHTLFLFFKPPSTFVYRYYNRYHYRY